MPFVWMNQHESSLLLIGLLSPIAGGGVLYSIHAASQNLPVVHLTNQQDRQRLMDLLKIESLRPGRNGSKKADPNYANYDESKAYPHPELPDPLMLKNGKKGTRAADWWAKRRPGNHGGFRSGGLLARAEECARSEVGGREDREREERRRSTSSLRPCPVSSTTRLIPISKSG